MSLTLQETKVFLSNIEALFFNTAEDVTKEELSQRKTNVTNAIQFILNQGVGRASEIADNVIEALEASADNPGTNNPFATENQIQILQNEINSAKAKITELENQTFRITYSQVQTISGGASLTGTLQLPANATFVTEQLAGGRNILLSESIDGEPNYTSPKDAGDNIISVNLDTNNFGYVLSNLPTSDIILIYVIDVSAKNLDDLNLDLILDGVVVFEDTSNLSNVQNQLSALQTAFEAIANLSGENTILKPLSIHENVNDAGIQAGQVLFFDGINYTPIDKDAIETVNNISPINQNVSLNAQNIPTESFSFNDYDNNQINVNPSTVQSTIQQQAETINNQKIFAISPLGSLQNDLPQINAYAQNQLSTGFSLFLSEGQYNISGLQTNQDYNKTRWVGVGLSPDLVFTSSTTGSFQEIENFNLIIQDNTAVTLTGGIFSIKNITLGSNSSLVLNSIEGEIQTVTTGINSTVTIGQNSNLKVNNCNDVFGFSIIGESIVSINNISNSDLVLGSTNSKAILNVSNALNTSLTILGNLSIFRGSQVTITPSNDIIKCFITGENTITQNKEKCFVLSDIFPSVSSLPISGNEGDQVFVKGNKKFYVYESGSWVDVNLVPGDNISRLTNDIGYITATEVATNSPVTSVNGRSGVVNLNTDNIPSTSTNRYVSSDEKNKISFIEVSQSVDLDQVEIDVNNNNAKVSADGSVTSHSDITNAGSGQIITGPERNALNSALQPGNNISELNNDASYVTASVVPSLAPVQDVNGLVGNVSLTTDNVPETANKRYLLDAERTAIETLIQSSSINSIENFLYVHPTLGEYNRVSDALNYISSLPIERQANTDNRWEILVIGNISDVPFTIPAFVEVRGLNAELAATNNNADFITIESSGRLNNISMTGPSVPGTWTITAGTVACSNITIFKAANGIRVNGGGGVWSNITNIRPNIIPGFDIDGIGFLVFDNGNPILKSSSIRGDVNAIKVQNNGSLTFENTIISSDTGAQASILVQDNGFINFGGITVLGDANIGVLINDSARFTGFSLSIQEEIGVHIEKISSTAKLELTNSLLNEDKLNLNWSSASLDFDSDTFEQERVKKIVKGFSIGDPRAPKESAFGEGDSTGVGLLVYTENENNTIINQTAVAKSPEGSVFSYQNNAANNSIYVSTDIQRNEDFIKFFGLKVSCSQVALYDNFDSVVSEYWNGASWVEFPLMSTQSEPPFLPAANRKFNFESEQLRFGVILNDQWLKNDPVGTGTDRFWVRIRLTEPITQLPVIQQIKVHTNRFEINEDGWPEYFGNARPTKYLPFSLGELEAANNSPQNQDIYLSDNLNVGRIENEFQNGTIDRIGLVAPLPLDLDTSVPIKVTAYYIGDDNNPNSLANAFWVARSGYSRNGITRIGISTDTAPGNAVDQQNNEFIITPPELSRTQSSFEFEIDCSEMIARRKNGKPDLLWIGLERQGTNINDTYTGDIALIALIPEYTVWNNGGHL